MNKLPKNLKEVIIILAALIGVVFGFILLLPLVLFIAWLVASGFTKIVIFIVHNWQLVVLFDIMVIIISLVVYKMRIRR